MKTRHIVFLVIALLFTAAALVSASLSNSFVREMRAEQNQEQTGTGETPDSIFGEAIGEAAGAFLTAIAVIFLLGASFVFLIPATIFATIDVRVPVLWLRIVSAVLLALDATSLALSVGTILRLIA